MQWSLFVLILMALCKQIFSEYLSRDRSTQQNQSWLHRISGQCDSCHHHEYHFINDTKTWKDAQSYCREHYTDLATVTNKADTERLNNVTKGADGAWIGLHNKPGNGNRKWRWSLPGVEFNESEAKWEDGGPNNGKDNNCVKLGDDKDKWEAVECTSKNRFICYDEKKSNKKFHLSNEEKTWPKAQSCCRENHTDLVSGLAQLEDSEFEAEQEQNEDLWIGLFRDTWRWSDGSNFSFRHSGLDLTSDGKGRKKCAMTANGQWSSEDCNQIKPFVCYDDKVILIKKELNWEQALNYCRKHHGDLVSITNCHQQRWVQERAKQAGSDHVWVGLLYSCFLDLWFWVDDNLVCYNKWAPGQGAREGCHRAAAMTRKEPHEWITKSDTDKCNFICTDKKS